MRALITILTVAFLASAAVAQDGGTESPLYDAQGVRALGTGGAVAAWLDDPSVLWWNPAALTLIPGKRIELQHTQNAVDTRTEQFAAGFPTLDYGAWAIGGALQTTTDITVTGSQSPTPIGTESFHRFRLAAGYATNTRYHIGLGAALKVVGYRFMGVERAAWGLDLGLLPFKRGGFSTALAVQNLLRPTFSFTEDNEDRWPRRAVIGAAMRTAKDKLVFSAQAEAAQDHDNRFRVGAEFAPTRSIAIRAGYNGDGPSVGVGAAYSRFRIDYAFVAPSDLGSEHRFGITINLGTPVAVQRQRRAARIEQQITTALDDARRQSREELEREADDAYRNEDWEAAAQAYTQLRLLFPEDSTYNQRLNELAQRRDSVVAARIESAAAASRGSERLALLNELYQQQIESNQWQAALQIANELERAGADTIHVAALRQEANDSLDAAYSRALSRARRALADTNAAMAAGWAQTALWYRPGDANASAVMRQAELQNSIQRATGALSEAVAQGDSAAVLSAAQNLLTLDPDNPLGQRYLKSFRSVPPAEVVTIEQIKSDAEAWEWYTQAFVEFRAGNYQAAIDLWQKVSERYPTNADTRKNIEQAQLRLESAGEDEQR